MWFTCLLCPISFSLNIIMSAYCYETCHFSPVGFKQGMNSTLSFYIFTNKFSLFIYKHSMGPISIFSYFKSCLSIFEAILIFIISGKLDKPICYGLNVCVPPLKFICWNPNSKCDGIRKWGLWEVIRVVRMESSWMVLVPYKGQKRPEFSSSAEWGQRWEPGKSLIRHQISWCLDLGLPNHQNCEK